MLQKHIGEAERELQNAQTEAREWHQKCGQMQKTIDILKASEQRNLAAIAKVTTIAHAFKHDFKSPELIFFFFYLHFFLLLHSRS
jgi:hypothetical protein